MNIKITDDDNKVIAEHSVNGIVLLASPDALEIEKLPKDEGKGFPLLSYQFGEPPMVMALARTLENIIPSIFQKWVGKMEEVKKDTKKEPNGIWTPDKKEVS